MLPLVARLVGARISVSPVSVSGLRGRARTLQPMPPYGSMESSMQYASASQVMASPSSVSPPHTFGQTMSLHASRQLRHLPRDMRCSSRKRHASSAESSAEAPLCESGQGGYLTPSDSKPQKRQCWPHSPACQDAQARSRGLHSAWVAT